MDKGLTVGGQTLEAFYVSVKHSRPLAVGGIGVGDLGRGASYMAMKGASSHRDARLKSSIQARKRRSAA